MLFSGSEHGNTGTSCISVYSGHLEPLAPTQGPGHTLNGAQARHGCCVMLAYVLLNKTNLKGKEKGFWGYRGGWF